MMGVSWDIMMSRSYSTAPKFGILDVQLRDLIASGDMTCLKS